ncbi:MAG: alpha-amylase [Chloroflexi bacterium]|nr:alpha-amylase [Chloroflexota bacterium]
MPYFEFHVSRLARDRYEFDEVLFALSGNVIFANFHAARVFAQKMNSKRDLVNFPEQAVQAGRLNAMGLIDELLHYIVAQYRQQVNPQALNNALASLNNAIGKDAVDATLKKFAEEFPSVAVYRHDIDPAKFLEGTTDGVPHREIVLEEMLMLWLANVNPAFSPFGELFDDSTLAKETPYKSLITNLYSFFDTQPRFGPDNQNLIDVLRAPAIASPHSLEGQLEFMRTRWMTLIGKYIYRLLSSLDLIKEEQKMGFLGPGESPVPMYKRGRGVDDLYPEYERFSRDLDWMPQLVLIAKSTYVWLDQLSKKYQRTINRLDEIPDEELDLLAHRGFTGLWFIGLWQRSPASKRIKELSGNMNPESSAYSVYEYRIADDLGGDAALENFKARAWQRGIRVASDMVPNHMGIDSRWVIGHPDWFVSADYPPFPSYTFNGPNLANDERVGIYLEDHYYNKTDAAVVFKRLDHWTGSAKYIYHGNDGTSFPWNDTAQLNFLNPQVREAVIQTILHVARQFPVIRLDAAMTLAKKHFQRLWFPQPGTGGDIPSRSEFALTKEQFDAAMPQEFWREVVDRVAEEAPNTLLLAEAFWLMEGYFVRTLGMHRVYNSAFMNMLRDEKNANYRSVIKNTIEFDPEILKRYVNFINNPDERTAVDQFGKGDKYFGVATLMATMPGLPMFGHGQIEGFSERYGMEFRRAMWDEHEDDQLVARHEREIFPLLHRRHVFAGVDNFLLYDFFTPDGSVNEDVFAFSNRSGNDAGLVIYHNKYSNTAGWVRTSAAYLDKGAGRLVQKNLSEGLTLHRDPDYFVLLRDQASGLEFIRNSKELCERGLYVELGAYQRHVFIDIREVRDNQWHQYAQLTAFLNGRGVPSIDEALREFFLQGVHQPFRELVNAETFRALLKARVTKISRALTLKGEMTSPLLDEIEEKYLRLAREAKRFSGGIGDEVALAKRVRREFEILLQMTADGRRQTATVTLRVSGTERNGVESKDQPSVVSGQRAALKYFKAQFGDDSAWATMCAWVFVHGLAQVQGDGDDSLTTSFAARSRSWIDEWLLGKLVARAFVDLGMSDAEAWRAVAIIKLMTTHQHWHALRDAQKGRAYLALETWLEDTEAEQFLQVNRFNGVLWFNKEAFETLLSWMFTVAVVELTVDKTDAAKNIVETHEVIKALLKAEKKSKYQVEKLLAALA